MLEMSIVCDNEGRYINVIDGITCGNCCESKKLKSQKQKTC